MRHIHKKIVICGRYIGFLDIDNQLVRLKSKEYRYFTNRNIDPVNLNKIYNESKICINIHQDQSRYGGNMRLYEVLAAGAFQIVDYNPYIEENFGKGLVTYKTSEDLMDTINYYLTYEDERNSIAKMGHGMVMNRDLFVNRAKTIIDDYLNKVNRK